ncbi:MAG TPA: Sir2 family NAD-dependent protein deacetylase [Nevskiaceae bacterium]|nr:Sir2 family NAD-dependent protein deacetylase [Nevskiaceae bacterium]
MSAPEQDIAIAREWIARSDGVVIAAGAGMGVDSGLPDFRGREGFWNHYPALKAAGIDFMRAASPATFRADAQLAWGFYGHRLNLYRRVAPHAGFALLRELAAGKEHGAFVFTSNVDGHFQRAGFADERVHECHGSIHHLQCLANCRGRIWSAEHFQPQTDDTRCRLLSPLPQCPDCGGLARPNILMFGDGGWESRRSDEQYERLARWLRGVRTPVAIELGAGTAVPSVRYFSESIGARVIRINPREAHIAPHLGIGLELGALQALPLLLGG